MIGTPYPYPKMKDSGIPWLGEVPEHWDVLPNRVLFGEVKERDHPEEPMLSVTITKGVIRQRALLANSSKKDSSNQDKSAYKLVRLGDIAYNKMRAWQGAIGVSDYQGIVSPAYVVERRAKGLVRATSITCCGLLPSQRRLSGGPTGSHLTCGACVLSTSR